MNLMQVMLSQGTHEWDSHDGLGHCFLSLGHKVAPPNGSIAHITCISSFFNKEHKD